MFCYLSVWIGGKEGWADRIRGKDYVGAGDTSKGLLVSTGCNPLLNDAFNLFGILLTISPVLDVCGI